MKRRLEIIFLNNKKPRYEENRTLKYTIDNAFFKPSTESFRTLLDHVSETPPSLKDCDFLLLKLSIFITRTQVLNRNTKPLLSNLACIAFQQFNNSLSQAPKDLCRCYPWISTQLGTSVLEGKLAFLIYNCGKIVGKEIDTPSWSASNLELLATLLSYKRIHSTKSIANFLYGLGLLAAKKKD